MSNIFEDGEVVLMRDDNVKDSAGNSVILILTNRRIIRHIRDFWGTGTVYSYPLTHLRDSKNVA